MPKKYPRSSLCKIGDEMDGETYEIRKVGQVRKMTDRCEQISPVDIAYPPDKTTFASSFVSDALAFTVKRKVVRIQDIANSIVENSAEQLDIALNQLAKLFAADPRLVDYLPNGVVPRLVEFLDDEKYPHKNYNLQYCSTLVLDKVVCSNKGAEVMKLAVPSLFKLTSSSLYYVQMQALDTLTTIARKFPGNCTTMLQHGVLELLKPLLEDDCIDYEVLESLGQLLLAFCQVNPSLPSDQIQKIAALIRTALHFGHQSSLIPISVAFSILSDRNQVEIGTEFARLQRVTDYGSHVIVLSSLRTIGNYVRWGTMKDIGMMLKQDLLEVLMIMLYHRREIVRKEACWIISNITAVAKYRQIRSIIRMRVLDMLVQFIKREELSVKKIAEQAIINAIVGSKRYQLQYFRQEFFPELVEVLGGTAEKEIHRILSRIVSAIRYCSGERLTNQKLLWSPKDQNHNTAL